MTKATRSRAALGRACMAGVLCASTALLGVPCVGTLAGGVEVAEAESEASAASQVYSEVTSAILEISKDYADSILSTVKSEAEELGVDGSALEGSAYGNPFYIYAIGSKDADKYYYPVVDASTNKVLCVVVMWQMLTDRGQSWAHCTSMEFIDGLNEIDYQRGGYLFYGDADTVFSGSGDIEDMHTRIDAGGVAADNGEQVSMVSPYVVDEGENEGESELQAYAAKSFAEKLADVKADVCDVEIMDFTRRDGVSTKNQSITLGATSVAVKRGGTAFVKVSGAKGKLKVTSSCAKVVAKVSGKKKVVIHVKKGAEKGTYKVKVRAKATGAYAKSKTKTITVKVK